MNLLFDSTSSLSGALSFHRRRHAVLAGNVANVDTPEYRPLDLERSVATKTAGGARTDSRHMKLSGSDGVSFYFDDADAPATLDGNTVNLERELAKVDANRVRYNTASRLVSKRLAALRYAASDGMG